MNHIPINSLRTAALGVSLLPLVTLCLTLQDITLTADAQYVPAGINLLCIPVGLTLSTLCFRRHKAPDVAVLLAAGICTLWFTMILAIFLTTMLYSLAILP